MKILLYILALSLFLALPTRAFADNCHVIYGGGAENNCVEDQKSGQAMMPIQSPTPVPSPTFSNLPAPSVLPTPSIQNSPSTGSEPFVILTLLSVGILGFFLRKKTFQAI